MCMCIPAMARSGWLVVGCIFGTVVLSLHSEDYEAAECGILFVLVVWLRFCG